MLLILLSVFYVWSFVTGVPVYVITPGLKAMYQTRTSVTANTDLENFTI